MTQLEDYSKEHNHIDKINWVINFDAEALMRREDFGTALIEAHNAFIQLQDYLKRIDTEKLQQFAPIVFRKHDTRNPYARKPSAQNSNIGNVFQSLDQAHDVLTRIANASPQKLGKLPIGSIEVFMDITAEIHKHLAPHLALIGKQQPTETQSTELKQMQEELQTAVETAQGYEQQLKQIVAGATAQASKSGVAAEARHFASEADRHNENAKKWLRVVSSATAILLGVAIYFYCLGLPADKNGIAWNHFIPRFSILGLLIFIDAVLIGIYRAERHNAVVNQHRANALNTFETMTAATLTQDVKDAITLTAAGAIYTPQDSGYSKRGAQQMPNTADILASIAANKT